MVYGTDNGIYLSDRRPRDPAARPRRVLEAVGVTQIDVLEEYQLLLVLANKNLLSFSLDSLEANDAMAKRPRKIQNHANFFKAGVCLGRHLVCCVKTSALSSTIKVFEPMETTAKNKKKPAFSKMFQGGQDALRPFKVSSTGPATATTSPPPPGGRSDGSSNHSASSASRPRRYCLQESVFTHGRQEFYIPAESSSIHFLKNKLCVGCAKGFEVVSLETLETQSLLDQADTSLDFVQRRENIKPIHIERLNGEFLLNYTDYSFFVNRNGWRAKADWKITWEGQPTAFALSYPYILAFEPSFIEIRNVETSGLEHILTAKNIRLLHSSTREVDTTSADWRPPLRPRSIHSHSDNSDSSSTQTVTAATNSDDQILYAYEDEGGEDVVASLDFWAREPETTI